MKYLIFITFFALSLVGGVEAVKVEEIVKAPQEPQELVLEEKELEALEASLSAKKDEKPLKIAETKPEPKPIWETNPQKCNLKTQWVWEDGSCHDKPVQKARPKTRVASGGCELVYNYSNWNQEVAHAVCLAESGGNTYAANYNDNHGKCRGSFGLMQLACFWITNPTDPHANMAKANEIYSDSGWRPWGAYTSGAYLRYL